MYTYHHVDVDVQYYSLSLSLSPSPPPSLSLSLSLAFTQLSISCATYDSMEISRRSGADTEFQEKGGQAGIRVTRVKRVRKILRPRP